MPTLDVETGLGSPTANSYVTLDEFREYAVARNITLPVEDDDIIPMLVTAMDYLRRYEIKFKGSRTYDAQALSWPRTSVCVFGRQLSGSVIPADIKAAQMYVAAQVAQGNDVAGTEYTRAITREKTGPIETEYSATAGATDGPKLPILVGILKPYFAGASIISSDRV